jgi:hypothetical protein
MVSRVVRLRRFILVAATVVLVIVALLEVLVRYEEHFGPSATLPHTGGSTSSRQEALLIQRRGEVLSQALRGHVEFHPPTVMVKGHVEPVEATVKIDSDTLVRSLNDLGTSPGHNGHDGPGACP